MSRNALLISAMVVGFFLIPTIAAASPEIVNGTLILLILGAILFHTDVWLPWFALLGKGLETPKPRDYATSSSRGMK